MSDSSNLISNGFYTFMTETPGQSQAWSTLMQDLGKASALDEKTASLAYLAVLAVLKLGSGIPFHVQAAKKAGATRDEVISAVLIGLPATGHQVTQVLPIAVSAYDEA